MSSPSNKGDVLTRLFVCQFLDCFSDDEVVSILSRVAKVMGKDSRLYIMESVWDRQKYEPAAMCLTLTSLYFTTMANGGKTFECNFLGAKAKFPAGPFVLAVERYVKMLAVFVNNFWK